jgi:sorbitol/mannitol transport system substrate-binding protein
VPPAPGTSLYENPEYAQVPFAQMTIDAINSADPNAPTRDPVPYTGVQFVAIPEFQGIGHHRGQEFSGPPSPARKTARRPCPSAQSR